MQQYLHINYFTSDLMQLNSEQYNYLLAMNKYIWWQKPE